MEHLTQQQLVRMMSVGTVLFYVISGNEQRCEKLLTRSAARNYWVRFDIWTFSSTQL